MSKLGSVLLRYLGMIRRNIHGLIIVSLMLTFSITASAFNKVLNPDEERSANRSDRSEIKRLILKSDTSLSLIDPCASTAILVGADSVNLFVCLGGDGERFDDKDIYIQIQVVDTVGMPIPGIPASDFWIVDADPDGILALCGDSLSCNADSATSVQGITTISGTITAGGHADSIYVVVKGVVIQNPVLSCQPLSLPVHLTSPDIDGDLDYDLTDIGLASFEDCLPSPPYTYRRESDMNNDGVIDLIDWTYFVYHSYDCWCH